ncbi:MAG: type II secretion system F family protein [Planctomycetes bacterium]|nr:type II secretion system F family protein [Planctomycetota bacterium]
MATWVYTARRMDGSSVTGSLAADSERAAIGALDRLGLFPVALAPEKGGPAKGATTRLNGPAPAKGATTRLSGPAADPAAPPAASPAADAARRSWQALFRRRIGAETAARFARELADLVKAGVPILRALDAVSQEQGDDARALWGAKDTADDQRARAVLREVRREVSQGAPLHQVLAGYPELFGSTAVSLIRAGEAGGFLDQALLRVATFGDRDVALQRRVKGALTYPVLLSLLSAGAVIFLLTWVVPRFSVIYEDLGGALPWPTRVLMTAGDLLSGHWYVGLGLLLAAGVGIGRWLSTEAGQRTFDAVLLRVPLLRNVIGHACVARFSRTLGTLLASGVSILQALEIAQAAAGNKDFSARLSDTLASLREGSGLAHPLRETRLFPPQVLEMIEVGQETGTLTDVLERAGERSDEEVDHALRTFVAVLEPAMIVAVAAVVFFVVVAALLPVFTLNTLVQ